MVIFLRNNPICKIGILFNVIAINDAKEFCLGCFILSLIMTLSFTKKESEWVSWIGVLIAMQTYPKLGEGGSKITQNPPHHVQCPTRQRTPPIFGFFLLVTYLNPKNPYPNSRYGCNCYSEDHSDKQSISRHESQSRVSFCFLLLSFITYLY